MHNKDTNKSRNFLQGLKPFSSSIPKTLKKYLRKGGYDFSNIVDNWTKIVSKKVSNACYPATIKINKEMKNGTLFLNVIHGKELEVEYQKNNIIDSVNSFFGYNCINQIKLKIINENVQLKKNDIIKIKNISLINEKIKRVKNEQLKESLGKLIKAFNDKNK